MSNPRGFVPRFMHVWRGSLAPGNRVGVAVSAGLDSCVLAALLGRLKSGLGIQKLVFLHFDHGIRPASERRRDVLVLRRLAAKFRVPLVIGRARVRSRGKGLEDAARAARLRFFAKQCSRHRLKTVALAHHLDDRIETFFLFLFRGSGCRGLSSLRAAETLTRPPIRVVRPLLSFTRDEIAGFAAAERIEYHEDSTNLDRQFLRNRIRLDLLPTLSDWLPQFRQAMAAAIGTLESEDEALELAAAEALCQSLIRSSKGLRMICLDRMRLRNWPKAIRARVLRTAGQYIGTSGLLGGHTNMSSAASAVGGTSVRRVDMASGHVLEMTSTQVILRRR